MDEMINSLKKKAVGYSEEEVTSEFIIDEYGERRLIKEKVQLKHFSPDISALKLYFELNKEKDFNNLSDEELEQERLRLLKELQTESL